MNDTFNIKRFGLLLKKDFQENFRKYLMRMLTLYGILTIVLVWFSMLEYDSSRYIANYEVSSSFYNNLITFTMFLMLGFGCISASFLMEPMSNKIRRISYLTLPSSMFEKFLSRWLVSVVGFLLVFLVAFWLADATRVLICSIGYPKADVQFIKFDYLVWNGELDSDDGRESWKYLFNSGYTLTVAMSFYFFMQSLFVLGATFWEKNTFIKTFSTGFAIFVSYILFCWGVISVIFDKGMDGFGRASNNAFPQNTKAFCMFIMGFLFFALVNWVIAFFRFKESEVIKRW